jgi:hypothetical protein
VGKLRAGLRKCGRAEVLQIALDQIGKSYRRSLRNVNLAGCCETADSARFSLGCSLAASILSLSLVYSCRHIPWQDAILRETSTPFYVGWSRTVSAKTTPIKVDDLNRGAYAPSGGREGTSNTILATVLGVFWRYISFRASRENGQRQSDNYKFLRITIFCNMNPQNHDS